MMKFASTFSAETQEAGLKKKLTTKYSKQETKTMAPYVLKNCRIFASFMCRLRTPCNVLCNCDCSEPEFKMNFLLDSIKFTLIQALQAV